MANDDQATINHLMELINDPLTPPNRKKYAQQVVDQIFNKPMQGEAGHTPDPSPTPFPTTGWGTTDDQATVNNMVAQAEDPLTSALKKKYAMEVANQIFNKPTAEEQVKPPAVGSASLGLPAQRPTATGSGSVGTALSFAANTTGKAPENTTPTGGNMDIYGALADNAGRGLASRAQSFGRAAFGDYAEDRVRTDEADYTKQRAYQQQYGTDPAKVTRERLAKKLLESQTVTPPPASTPPPPVVADKPKVNPDAPMATYSDGTPLPKGGEHMSAFGGIKGGGFEYTAKTRNPDPKTIMTNDTLARYHSDQPISDFKNDYQDELVKDRKIADLTRDKAVNDLTLDNDPAVLGRQRHNRLLGLDAEGAKAGFEQKLYIMTPEDQMAMTQKYAPANFDIRVLMEAANNPEIRTNAMLEARMLYLNKDKSPEVAQMIQGMSPEEALALLTAKRLEAGQQKARMNIGNSIATTKTGYH